MKKQAILTFVSLILTIVAYSQTGNDINIGVFDSIPSEILKEEQWVMVYVPESRDKDEKFPVMYVLDGNWRFHSTVGMVKELGGSVIPEMMVVGILNNNRFRDFSPAGTENFTQYLEKELFPHIEKNYPAAPYRMLVGHSIAGLFAVNTLVHHTDFFKAYAIIDPSLSVEGNQELLNRYLSALRQKKFKKTTLQLGIANTLPEGSNMAIVKDDTTSNTLHIRSILQLKDELAKPRTGLRFNSTFYDSESHSSIPLIATYDALRYIFNYFEMPENVWEEGAKAGNIIKSHFDNISNQLGYTLLPPEDFLNSLGYYIMGRGDLQEAETVFKMNIENYPSSFNAYDSMGDLYGAKGDKDKAMEHYKKALAIHDKPDTRKKLEKLKKE